VPTAIAIYPNIQQLWSWIKAYEPWRLQLKLAFDSFGEDTGLVDRQEVPIHIGDILSGNQHNTIWSGINQGDQQCLCLCSPPDVVSLTPEEWSEQHNPTKKVPPFPPPNPYLDPHQDPWKIFDPHIVQLPERTCHTYFIFEDPVLGIVGRTFFECEQTFCTGKESEEMYLSDFSNVVVIGNITDTPEQFQLNHTSEEDSKTKSPIYFKRITEEQHFA
jgi:hypothetical protein